MTEEEFISIAQDIEALAPTIGVIVIAIINYFGLKSAKRATIAAQVSANDARINALEVHRATQEAARISNQKLDQIADKTEQVHTLVNGSHSQLVQLVAELTERVARENPGDAEAQAAAKAAKEALLAPLRKTDDRQR